MTTTTPLLTVRQLAEQLELPVAWLKSEVINNRIPCLRIGRRMLFDATAVEQVLALRARGVDITIGTNTREAPVAST